MKEKEEEEEEEKPKLSPNNTTCQFHKNLEGGLRFPHEEEEEEEIVPNPPLSLYLSVNRRA